MIFFFTSSSSKQLNQTLTKLNQNRSQILFLLLMRTVLRFDSSNITNSTRHRLPHDLKSRFNASTPNNKPPRSSSSTYPLNIISPSTIAMGDLAVADFDPAFIQAPEHRHKPTITIGEGLPVIDLGEIDISKTIAEIGDACRNWGFFQVVNHGVDLSVREKAEAAARSFFALPIEEKLKVRRDEVNPLGYYDFEHTKNVRDWKEVFDYSVNVPVVFPASPLDDDRVKEMVNQWSNSPPDFKEACEEYGRVTEKLAFKLLELISLSLGLNAGRLKGFFEDQTSFVRLNHYPPCPAPNLALGVGRHKDGGALTVLAQDEVGGLEVKRKSDGEWILVQPIPNAYIINVGDIIQVWSNAEYESVEHRVMVNPEKDRLSMPFFFNPAHYTIIEPLEELVTEGGPAKYKAYNWGKFLANRKMSNFKKLDAENIQIDHFKVSE